MPIETSGRVVGLHVNPQGGVPKHPVKRLEIAFQGCLGDRQNDRKHHGGPQRAVCFMFQELMDELAHRGHPISPGSTGENLLIQGLAHLQVHPGCVIQVGDVVLEVTGDAKPCKTIGSSFIEGSFHLLSHKKFPGNTRWYAKVITEGSVVLGDEVRLLQ